MTEERLSVAEAAKLGGVDPEMIQFWIDFAYFPQPPDAETPSVPKRDFLHFLDRRRMNELLTRAHRQRPDLGWLYANCPACERMMIAPSKPHRNWVCSAPCKDKVSDHEAVPDLESLGVKTDAASGQPQHGPAWLVNPDYRFDLEPIPAKVTLLVGGEVVGESTNARVALEQGHSALYYLPLADLRMEHFRTSDYGSYCHFKGFAEYWHIEAGGERRENAAWAYPQPYEETADLAGLVGFLWHSIDQWLEDGQAIESPRDIVGRIGPKSTLKALYPELAAQWHKTKNINMGSYEVPPFSKHLAWWQDAEGRAWQERICDRTLGHKSPQAE
ncbi:MAG: DUF427 domain-containing protein [Kiloniellales bacterium]